MSIDPAVYAVYEALEQTGWNGNPADLSAALKETESRNTGSG